MRRLSASSFLEVIDMKKIMKKMDQKTISATFVDPTQARVMDQGKGWKAFPGRRLPGKNMEQF